MVGFVTVVREGTYRMSAKAQRIPTSAGKILKAEGFSCREMGKPTPRVKSRRFTFRTMPASINHPSARPYLRAFVRGSTRLHRNAPPRASCRGSDARIRRILGMSRASA